MKSLICKIFLFLSLVCFTPCVVYSQNSNAGKVTQYNSTNQFVVIQDQVPATTTKEADKRLTNYSINNDKAGLAMMILAGELAVLSKGEIVTVLDYGVTLSKIRRYNGDVLYISTDFIKRK